MMFELVARGWVCVTINYRLSPKATWPDSHRRRQSRDGVGQGAHRRVRRRPVVRGGQRRLGRRTPLRAAAALSAGDPHFQPGFEDADTTVEAAVPFYGVMD